MNTTTLHPRQPGPLTFVRELQHRGRWRGVPEWAADDGKLLQEELDQSYGALALDLSAAVLWPVSAE
jgi:hypothetical protein